MTHHIPEDQMRSFVDGNVDEELAVEIAVHIDSCVTCALRAETLEPLREAFAAAIAPVPSPALFTGVLAELERPERLPGYEFGIGAALIAAAALVAVLTGDPVAIAVKLGVIVDALSTASSKLSLVTNASLFALSLTTIAVSTLSLAAARFAIAEGRMS